jgi:hypothetical protein
VSCKITGCAPGRNADERSALLPTAPEAVHCAADAFFAEEWSLCVEAAGQVRGAPLYADDLLILWVGGQPAVIEHGKRCLTMGRDFMVSAPQPL